jgi:hypothetical protein
MKIFQTIFIILVLFQYIDSYPTGSDKCYKEMPLDMATTNPTISLTITTNNGLNDYESCGRIPITLEFSGTIRGLLMMVISNSSDIVGRFEENSRFHTINGGVSMGSCITHSHNIEKSGPITLYWSAPDIDEDLTIIAFVVRSRAGEPTTATWGEAYLNISYSNTSICPTEDTKTIESSSESTDTVNTEIDNTETVNTEDTNTIESYTGPTEIVDNTETVNTEDPTDNTEIVNTETDNITESPTDNTELSSNDSEVFSTEGVNATDIENEDTEDFTDMESDTGEVTSQNPSSSQISTSSISKTSTKKPSSTKGSTNSISRTSALSGTRTQESTSNTELIIFGFGLLLFSLLL